ncbi:MAG: lysylphosphatidylglycerol synthase transmembrane domain-containing protein, partial [Candidatus Marinimicrobia bacterium]|nr:lysylphosphatidylglycerol synthase transmembrane domain-containing protein [Candidatus Neomarinimicrobiota bacterium]
IYLLAATVMLWISVWFRGIRWKWLFKEENSPTTSSLYKAELIGYFGNNVLPLRLGELLRSYLVGKEWNLSKGFVVGTVVLERLLDTLSLAVLSLLLLFVFPLEEPVKTYVITGGFLSIIGVFTALLFIGKIRNLSSQHRLVTIIKNIFDGLLSIRKEVVLHVMLSSLIIWLIYWLDVYLIQLAFQL